MSALKPLFNALLLLGLLALWPALFTSCNQSRSKQDQSSAHETQSHNGDSATVAGRSASTTPPASSPHPWPTYGQNNQRNSRSPLPGPEDPRLLWSTQLTGDNSNYFLGYSRSPLIARGNVTYVQIARKVFNAVDAQGNLLWAVSGERNHKQPLIMKSGDLLCTGDTTYTIDSATGKISRLYDKDIGIPGLLEYKSEFDKPMQLPSGNLLVQAKFYLDSKVEELANLQYCALLLDRSGNMQWRATLPGFSLFEMAASPAGTVFIPTSDELVALDPDGNMLWEANVPSGGYGDRVVYGSSTCIITYENLRKYCEFFDDRGKLSWSKDYSPLRVSGVAIDNQQNLVVALNEGRKKNGPKETEKVLLALDSEGNELWRNNYIFFHKIIPTIDVNDNIYFGFEDGIVSLNPDGKERWRIDLPEAEGQVAIGEDRKLFVLCRGGTMNCIGEADP